MATEVVGPNTAFMAEEDGPLCGRGRVSTSEVVCDITDHDTSVDHGSRASSWLRGSFLLPCNPSPCQFARELDYTVAALHDSCHLHSSLIA